VKLKLSPNTLTVGEEIAKFCEDEIRILRRFMRTSPEKTGEHYEVWVAMPGGNYSSIEVLPEILKDKESGAVLSPQPVGGEAP
jgi:HSP20 family molecular chaperone IbpA